MSATRESCWSFTGDSPATSLSWTGAFAVGEPPQAPSNDAPSRNRLKSRMVFHATARNRNGSERKKHPTPSIGLVSYPALLPCYIRGGNLEGESHMAFGQSAAAARPIEGAVATMGVSDRVTFLRKTYAHVGFALLAWAAITTGMMR